VSLTLSGSVAEASVTVCGEFQLAVVNVRLAPRDTLSTVDPPVRAVVTTTLLVGCAASMTVNVTVPPSRTVTAIVETINACVLLSSSVAVTVRLAKLSPKTAVKNFEKELSPSDVEVVRTMGEPREVMALFTNAFLKSARGVVDDYRSVAGLWGVDFDSIEVPVRIFQGTADTMVPLWHAEELARRIPHAELVTWPGEGHLGTVTHVDEILAWLASRWD